MGIFDEKKRKEAILKKYGSWENYEKKRAETTRRTALARCKTKEEKELKLKELEFNDFLKDNYDESKIGKEIPCTVCGKKFKGNTRQQMYCWSCLLRETKIRKHGSLEEYNKKSNKANRKTKEKRYGDPTYNNREKARQTCLERYGVTHQSKTDTFVKKMKETKKERYGDPNYVNKEKAVETIKKRYGGEYTNTAQVPEFQEKARQTRIRRYGDPNFNNRPQATQTFKERYGGEVTCPFHVEEFKEKALNTLQENYGEEYTSPAQVPELKEKIIKTTKERYGVECVFNLKENRKKAIKARQTLSPEEKLKITNKMLDTFERRYGTINVRRYYYYDKKYFDSSWELYFYVYAKDKKLPINCKPERIQYEKENGSLHYYVPDFKIEDKYVEIKGPHLINEDGILTDFNGNVLEEKTNLIKELGVVMITDKEIAPIISYVEDKYGKDLAERYKVKRKTNDESK